MIGTVAPLVGSDGPVNIGIRIVQGRAVFYAESAGGQGFAQDFDTIEDALLGVEESLLLLPETKTELLEQAAFLVRMS